MTRLGRTTLLLCGLPLLVTLSAGAGARASETEEAESQRFNNQDFYEGLIELGLLDLLDYHLAENPPSDELTGLLLQRKVKLVVWENHDIASERRRASLADANAVLAQMIREHGADRRALQWQLDLAQSLIYEQAEPYYTNILYRGGTDTDFRALAALMTQATDVLESLRKYLEAEYARIDDLSVGAYERLDESGYVQRIEEAMPQTDYMLRWAKFYAALAMKENDATRRALLAGVLDDLVHHTTLLTTDHITSHVQAQSLLLAGMISRRLADDESANRYLRDAGDIAAKLPNIQERRDLQWVVLLSTIERVRALRDAQRFDEAMSVLNTLRNKLERESDIDFGRKLILAILDASIQQARTSSGPPGSALASALTEQAATPLLELAKQQPAYRDEVYAAIYEQLRDTEKPEMLHPLQQCALIAGLIGDATSLRRGLDTNATPGSEEQRQAEANAVKMLDRAIDLANDLVAQKGDDAIEPFRCEILFNLGVAQHLRGKRVDAAKRFAEVANECPRFDRSLSAATYGVEIAAELANDPSLRARAEVRDLLIETLRTLIDRFPDSDAAHYWRFFYAQALEDVGDMSKSAEQYARVDRDHPQATIAAFRSGRARALAVIDNPDKYSNPDLLRDRVERARDTLADFRQRVKENPGTLPEDQITSLSAESDVLSAELALVPGNLHADDALRLLDDFEKRYPEQQYLIGRVLRARIIAYDATGRIADAERAVPQFIASAPDQAGATLQTLYESTWAEAAKYRNQGDAATALAKAKSALLFADELYKWATSPAASVTDAQVHALRLQLAETHLAAGNPAQCLELIDKVRAHDAEQSPDGKAHDPRVLMTTARALFALKRYNEALPLFNRTFQEAPADAPHRFEALLGDLQCRTELGEDPAGIISVIRQYRFLAPDLGGEALKQQFVELQERNEARQPG
ncbi:MAG: hypothetical protein H6817_08775 [Phycisphaerales bacterium]|nr:hypothetical protein [Phycisphaerales bacterium]